MDCYLTLLGSWITEFSSLNSWSSILKNSILKHFTARSIGGGERFGNNSQGLVVIKTGSYCKLLHGGYTVDAEMAAFLFERNVFFIKRREKKQTKPKAGPKRPKIALAPIGSHRLYEVAQLGAKEYEWPALNMKYRSLASAPKHIPACKWAK